MDQISLTALLLENDETFVELEYLVIDIYL